MRCSYNPHEKGVCQYHNFDTGDINVGNKGIVECGCPDPCDYWVKDTCSTCRHYNPDNNAGEFQCPIKHDEISEPDDDSCDKWEGR